MFRSSSCPLERELEIYDATSAKMSQILYMNKNKRFPHALHVLFKFLYGDIFFPFAAIMRREMTISKVIQRTWTLSREIWFSFLALTPHLKLSSWVVPLDFKWERNWHNDEKDGQILSDVFAIVASLIFISPKDVKWPVLQLIPMNDYFNKNTFLWERCLALIEKSEATFSRMKFSLSWTASLLQLPIVSAYHCFRRSIT